MHFIAVLNVSSKDAETSGARRIINRDFKKNKRTIVWCHTYSLICNKEVPENV